MASNELYDNYRSLVDKYELLRQRIDRANEQRGKFRSQVVERVIFDYEKQLKELERELAPCEESLFGALEATERARGELALSRESLSEQVDELDLRALLGEFDPSEVDDRKAEIQGELDQVSARAAELEREIASIRDYLERAGAMARRGASAPIAAEPRTVVPVPPPAQVVRETPAISSSRVDTPPVVVPVAPLIAPPVAPPVAPPLVPPVAATVMPPVVVPTPPVYVPPPTESLVSAFDAVPPASTYASRDLQPQQVPDYSRNQSPYQVNDQAPGSFVGILDDLSPADEGGLPPLSDAGGDSLADFDQKWEKDLENDFPPAGGLQEILGADAQGGNDFPNLNFGDQGDDLPPLGLDAPPVATLTRHFGKPDADRYVIQEDITQIGRGRDNHIQIKDDTKVSRYHCKITREGGVYYIEDNNSSNGTLVNGELATRRRLEGNEDLTIGETVFRFELR